MQAVEKGDVYDLIDPKSGLAVASADAREVFDKIVHNAWQNGEPGIIFLDRLNRDNAVPSQGEIESTNPCGEQPLLPYESCNLGSINLVAMAKQSGRGYRVDFDKLKQTVKDAVHFLDNVIEVNRYPLPQIDEVTKSTRKIGLGVMGFADLLLLLGIPYNSAAAVELAEQLMDFITTAARSASAELAKTRGAFPLFEESIYAGGRLYATLPALPLQPTGTLSIIAGCSSGVEPILHLCI